MKDVFEKIRAYPEGIGLNPAATARAEAELKKRRRTRRARLPLWLGAAACLIALAVVIPLLFSGPYRVEIADLAAFAAETDYRFRYVEEEDFAGDFSAHGVTIVNSAYRLRGSDELAYICQQAEFLTENDYVYSAEVRIVPDGTKCTFGGFDELPSKIYVDETSVRYRVEQHRGKSEIFARFAEDGACYYLHFSTERSEQELLEFMAGYFEIVYGAEWDGAA